MTMTIFDDKFSTGQVIKATGVSNPTLQSWLKRNMIIGHKEGTGIEGAGSPGVYRRFSFFNVMEIAVAKALIDVGVKDLTAAFEVAREFAHTGDGPVFNQPGRQPSTPFNEVGITLLCVGEKRSECVHWQPGKDPLSIIFSRLKKPEGIIILHMNKLFDRVTSALGYHPEKVLQDAYAP